MSLSVGGGLARQTLAVLRKFRNNSVERDLKNTFRKDRKKMAVLLFYLSLPFLTHYVSVGLKAESSFFTS